MTALISLYDRLFGTLEARIAPILMPTLARLIFAGTLLLYYWNSGLTKIGVGLAGIFQPNFNAYAQILPRMSEAVSYDASQLGGFWRIVVLFATWGEFILPLLVVVGLLTRLGALGMVGFVVAQSWVDIFGHGVSAEDRGNWFDAASGGLILDQRAFWVFLLLYLVVRGGGPLSVDALLRSRLQPQTSLA